MRRVNLIGFRQGREDERTPDFWAVFSAVLQRARLGQNRTIQQGHRRTTVRCCR